MPRKDTYHDAVVSGLEHEGWAITDDPLRLAYGGRNLYVDLGAENLLAATKGGRQIAVEIKSFVSVSDLADLENALGQYVLYRDHLRNRPGGTSAMDRLTLQKAVHDLVYEYAAHKPSHGQIETEAIVDDEKGHYEVMMVGWDGERRVHGTAIHIDIIGEKIWIQHDGTSPGVALELVEAGVPRESIVLGFRPAHARPHTGFAVN